METIKNQSSAQYNQEESERVKREAKEAEAELSARVAAISKYLAGDSFKKSKALNKHLLDKIDKGESLSIEDGKEFAENYQLTQADDKLITKEAIKLPSEEELKKIAEEEKRLIIKHGSQSSEVVEYRKQTENLFAECSIVRGEIIKSTKNKMELLKEKPIKDALENLEEGKFDTKDKQKKEMIDALTSKPQANSSKLESPSPTPIVRNPNSLSKGR